MAGGKGTRIKKYLNGYPKPLVKINNNRFLYFLLKYFLKYIFGKIYILAGYKGQKIKNLYHGKNLIFCDVEVIIEKKPMGTGGQFIILEKK